MKKYRPATIMLTASLKQSNSGFLFLCGFAAEAHRVLSEAKSTCANIGHQKTRHDMEKQIQVALQYLNDL
jgi:hypothetical protein